MNKLTIPSSPNWYESDIMACAPDNTLLYGSRQDLVVIKPTPADQPDDLQVISKAHSMKIVSVNLNRNWGEPHKYSVTVSEDKIIKVWDIEKMEKVSSHDKHVSDQSKIVGASFSGDARIVSVSEVGSVIIWYLLKKETNLINSLFGNKVTVTCLSICPHTTYLAAFGLKSGLIVVADLRRTGHVLYSLRGHSKSVVSLAWCPAPVNVFPMKPLNRVVEKLSKEELVGAVEDLEVKPLEAIEDPSAGKSSELMPSADKSPEAKQLEDVEQPADGTESLASADKSSEETQSLQQASEDKSPDADKSSEEKDLQESADESFEAAEQQASADSHACENSRRKQKNPKKRLSSSTLFTHSYNPESGKKPTKPKASISDFLAKTQKDASCSSEESTQFCSASSCEDQHCMKHTTSVQEDKKLENDVFYDAQALAQAQEEKVKHLVHEDEPPRYECLLASSAREPNIYIWRAGTDGRMQTFMKVPAPKKTINRKKAKETQPWITLCWPAPTTLLSSSHTAELLQWTLPKPSQNAKFFRTIHREHWSVLFSIKVPVLYLDEYNFLQKRLVNVWTTGMERTIVNTDLDNGETLCLYPAFGGSVNCLDGSPLDPNRLAIGTGEGLVNTWDLSRPHIKSITFSSFYNQILSSVTAVAWHPAMENILAWGTVEGRIGVIDVVNKSRQPTILKQYFKSQIFKLEWGPISQKTAKHHLFAVGESKVAIFDAESREKDPELLDLPDNTSVFTMAWKPDYSMLLVSAKSGTIITYNTKLEIQNISYLSNKLLSIKWHPDAVSHDKDESNYCNIFASLIKHSEVVVVDLSDEGHKIVAKFENRSIKVNGLTWSPHSGNFLAFVDDDGIAQVFDIESKSIVSTYISSALDHLLCVHWSPLDPDFIITGTISHKIVVWKISENPALTEKEINTRKNKITKVLQKEVGDLLSKEKEAKKVEAIDEPPKAKAASKSELVPLFYSPKESTCIEDMRRLLQNKLLNNVEASSGDAKTLDIMDIFGDAGNIEKLFQLNLTNFKKHGHFRKANLLALLQGDLSEAIKEAIDQRRVDPWIISMCPMVSPRLWQKACETYVRQLLEEPEADPMEIVTYMLAGHEVEEAVNFLKDRELYREAFLLAKSRFGADNSITEQVTEAWAKKATYQGNFELAAACYISLEKYSEAAAVLFRRSNVKTLEFAADLAKLADNEELHKAIILRLKAYNVEDVYSKVLVEAKLAEWQKVVNSFVAETESKQPEEINLSTKIEESTETLNELNDAKEGKLEEEKPINQTKKEESNASELELEEVLKNEETNILELLNKVQKMVTDSKSELKLDGQGETAIPEIVLTPDTTDEVNNVEEKEK